LTHDANPSSVDITLKARQRFAQRFDILRPLGQGGMGAVYLARDTTLGRDVAIKTLRTDHLEPAQRTHWLQTFRREATSTARLQHPHILTLHDFGIEADRSGHGVPYLVLEYLRGTTLRVALKTEPFGVERTLALAKQLAAALMHAHAHDVIHRDLKPSNLFLEPGDRLKVMDFGAALLRTDRHALASNLGRAPEALGAHLGETPERSGTPVYMAPEQILGRAQDGRTDLWAFGVVMYQCLIGHRPFNHPLQSLRDPLPPLDVAGLPERFRDVLRACLQKNPKDRPSNAAALVEQLQAIPSGAALPSVSTTRAEHTLPARFDAFVGRQHELQRLDDLLIDNHQCITIAGPAGSGKTRLALEFAASMKRRVSNVFFCDLTDAHTLEDMTLAVAQVLGLRLTQRDAIAQLGHAIARRDNLLIVLDNFEQLVEHATTALEAWMDAAPAATFIVTSRQALGVLHETCLQLDPLPVPEHTSPELLRNNDAVSLFVARAQQYVPDFEITSANESALTDLIRALDGLPLAIELAAARIRVFTPAPMLNKIHRRFDLLRTRPHALTPRHATPPGAPQ